MNFYNTLHLNTLHKMQTSYTEALSLIKDAIEMKESSVEATEHPDIFKTVDGFAVVIGDDIESVDTYEDALEIVDTFIMD